MSSPAQPVGRWGWWGRLPLRTQLSLLFALVLVVGLVLTGTTALAMLRQSLVAQLDEQLDRASRDLVAITGSLPRGAAEADLPSDYQAVFVTPDGEVWQRWSSRSGSPSVADIPALSVDEVVARDGQAFTVGSVGGGPRWRVLARPLVAAGTQQVVGSVAVALPTTAADATLARMRWVLVAIGTGVVGLGALAGSVGVRRALRPLRQIEDTAAAIAAGDLARRVPDAPTTTEVGRLAAALNGMLAQIEAAFGARTASEQRMRRFVSDASHELRTPLATIRGYGELYRMGAVPPEDLPDTVRRMEEAATRMGRLVQDLLDLARLDEGRGVRREPVDLAVVVHDAAADLRALDPARAVRVEPLTPGAPTGTVVVPGDEDRLRQVLANLVGNAVRHTPPGTPVELALGRRDAEVVVEVRDHGPGIDPEHAARVFERFYRVDAARGRESGGAGLGMAIVAAIVTAHGGTVGIDRTPGGGATVRVMLPAT
ncbi:HAMP domain-containing histidine kinase [Actinotalea ferrariae]|uniref:sensor histidine kinase n=1 Tax=Actinotalea ferrariae TaxID=1386098 RepID=UPI001C8CDC07|nr:HAMP domain-containing sensor histidine kinase [Actinotalea ferrariae]MBX9245799.1 HAMP domain-containing histidine kinase [Actinotalea ferrariae]